MNSWLLDTGPVVAYLDPRDRAHSEVAPVFGRFTGELFTTSAVVTEAMQFASRYPAGPGRLADFIAAIGLSVFDLTQPAALPEVAGLMHKYADLPMDFADATLTLLAEQLGISQILTLDRRGFAVYRTRDGNPFHLVLDSA